MSEEADGMGLLEYSIQEVSILKSDRHGGDPAAKEVL